MSQATAIEWTDVSWNPVHGCSKVDEECDHCYAETLSLRYRHTTLPWTAENAAENVILKPKKLRQPLSEGKQWQGLGAAAAAAGKTDGMLVFVNSMSDLFHPRVPGDFIASVFDVMEEASRHTFQVLTKRPKRMREWCRRHRPDPLPNVWLGTSIGVRKAVGRADLLRETPAAVRFISAEPLLEPLIYNDQTNWSGHQRWPDGYVGPELDLTGIDWLIAGGESGSEHRPMDVAWVRDLLDACKSQYAPCACGTWPQPRAAREGVCLVCGDYRPVGQPAFFFKQLGGARPGGEALLDGREWHEFPAGAAS